MGDFVSVIMPVYNLEKYVAKSIESVLNQTYDKFELIIVNDGSIDETENIIGKYMAVDHRIVYIKQKNQGVSVARNTGIEAAKGDYISFLDGDDLWHCDFLEKMINFVHSRADEVKFAYGKTFECFENGRKEIIGGNRIINGYLEDFVAPNGELRLAMHISALFVARDMIRKYNIRFMPGMRLSEDTGFMIEILCVAKAYGINEVLTDYIRRGSSATSNTRWEPEFWAGHTKIYEVTEDFVKKYRLTALPYFKQARGYVAYRFILGCLKHGYIQEAIEYRKRWYSWMVDFAAGDGKIKDRLKCRLILSAKRQVLVFIGKF